MYSCAALHLISSLEVRIGLIPIQSGKKAMKEICPIIVRVVSPFDSGKQPHNRNTEMAREIASHLPAGVRELFSSRWRAVSIALQERTRTLLCNSCAFPSGSRY